MRELIILGKGQSWKDCPFDAECWATSTVLEMPEISNYHQIHKVFAFDDYNVTKNGLRTAKKYRIPIVSTQGYATEKYPFEDIVRELGYSYFRPTVSYMIAYAIYQGYEKLRLYGIDQAPEWEHLINKPYVMFWLGVATGRKVKWELSKFSILLETMGDLISKYVIELKARAKAMRQYMENQS
uniref:Putative methyltransferase n=1 Tax=viral metagenome TaxID=1070528 RepID=A0A6M3L4T9_9ZZZZ